MARFYVTTPIYYVNDLPHIGHIYTTVVGDTLARYRRMAGDDVRFLTGTDEHGQKIERAAKKEGLEPIQLADRVVARYHELWKKLSISHDDFIRTTQPRHERGVEAILERMIAAGDVYEAKHEGWYCTGCETFYTEKELRQPGNLCPDHGTPTEWKSEENLFFRLSKYEQPLLELYDRDAGFVRPESRRNEVRAFVAGGLKDLSISRFGLGWGVPFPGHAGHSIWVWLDALTNYISALGYGAEKSDASPDEAALFRRYWLDGNTRLHLVGKDIVRFHAVFWPAFLMSAGVPLPTTVWAHGWWQRDGQKMSKSVGNVVRPDHLIGRFGGDSLRYFLLREMVFGLDASFSDEAFVDRFNADLANDLGNTASRVVTLSRQAFGGRTPPTPCDDNPLIAVAREVVAEYRRAMDELAFQTALRSLWRLLAEANQYLVEREPWKTIKKDGPTESLSRVLWNGLECVRIVATALLPAMPDTAARVLRGIGAGDAPATLDALGWGGMPTGAELPALDPIFPRIDKEKYMSEIAPAPAPAAPAPEGAPQIDIQQFLGTELKVGRVLSCENVPKSEKLLKLRVDLGEPGGPRQVLAGIAKAYKPEELVDTEVILVANLKPAKLMGMESQGMILAATDAEGQPILLRPHKAGAAPGTRVK